MLEYPLGIDVKKPDSCQIGRGRICTKYWPRLAAPVWADTLGTVESVLAWREGLFDWQVSTGRTLIPFDATITKKQVLWRA